MGGNQPVARTTFYLLDDDPEKLMRAAGVGSEGALSVLDVFAFGVKYDRRRTPAFTAATESIASHTKQTVMTDFNGKAQFTDIAPGRYFIFGTSNTRKGYAIWSLAVDIKAGQNSIILDQNNAATAL